MEKLWLYLYITLAKLARTLSKEPQMKTECEYHYDEMIDNDQSGIFLVIGRIGVPYSFSKLISDDSICFQETNGGTC